ncbi:uncharacterized protein LOC106637052 [Copidosoma floridanum]|uniref:uncharacterized protein LOC106637052 n=1 Tax=Copidosoma floridanum TaxID=29053 RepID=UPI0006C9D2E5|nr:uncharacterized protein LOC106637052 [Copidosoma floridanum]
MRQKIPLIVALALCVFSASAGILVENPDASPRSTVSEFSFDLYGAISSTAQRKNLICSPLSGFIALSMLERGTKGKTANRMRQSLRLPNDESVINRSLKKLMNDFNDVDNTLSVANKMFVSNKLKIKDQFMQLTREIFKSEAANIDTSDPSGSAKTINDWVSEKTHDKIKKLIEPKAITSDTRLILVNALYFKGEWEKAFTKELTTMESFTSTAGEIKVPMMSVQSNYLYGRLEDAKATFIHLPYKNQDFEMVIVVPDEADGLNAVEEKLASYDLSNHASMDKVRLFLPKFKFESTIDLKEPLTKIGLAELFESPYLSGISDDPLRVSQVVQKAVIEVDEQGSVAAAATAVESVIRSSKQVNKPPVVVRVDRPFYFMIRKSRAIIFQGHVYNPLLTNHFHLFLFSSAGNTVVFVMDSRLFIWALILCVTSAAEVNDKKTDLTALKVLSRSSHKFGSDLFKLLSIEKKNENLICSTLSAHVALSMATYGARGPTFRAMREALKLPANGTFALSGFQSLVEDLNSIEKVDLEMANGIYIDKTLQINDWFKKLTSMSFKAETTAIDTSVPAQAAKKINDWVDEKTHHKITNIILEDDIDPNTRMIIMNALYFKGKWAKKFDDKFTVDLPFHVAEGKQIAVPMMHINETFTYGKLDSLKARFIEIPYENKDLRLVIIVPDEKDGLSEVESNLGNLDYKNAIKNARRRLVYLSMPKFKIESNIELKKSLSSLNMARIFEDQANFKGISNEPLKINQVKQKAFIEVNEEGSKAVAITTIDITLKAFFDEPPPVFLKIDHPFMFAIRKADLTLFQGHVYNPLLS